MIAGGTRPNVVAERCAPGGGRRGPDARRPRGGRGGESARSPRRPRSPTRPSTSTRWPAGGRWRSSSAAAGWSSTRRPSPGASASRSRDTATGGASDANTTSGHGRPEPRRARARSAATTTPRRSTSTSTRSCRGPRCSPACCSPIAARPGGAGLAGRAARVTGERRARISSGGPWEAVAATAGRSSSATLLGRRHDRCRAGRPVAASGRRRARRRGRPRRSSSAALAEAGFALDDVVRTRMFVTDIAEPRTSSARPSARCSRDIRPAATLVEVAALIDPSLLVEIEATRAALGSAVRPASASQAGRAGRSATSATRRDEAEEQVPPPGDDGRGRRRPRATRCPTWNVGHAVVVDDDHDARPRPAPRARPARRAAGSRARLRQAVDAGRQQAEGPRRVRDREHQDGQQDEVDAHRSAVSSGVDRAGSSRSSGRRASRSARRTPPVPERRASRRRSAPGRAGRAAGRRCPPATMPIDGPTTSATTTADGGADDGRDELAPAGDQARPPARPSPPGR